MQNTQGLNTPVRYLSGVGPKRAELFNGMGINTVEDLLYYFPRRYEDRTSFTAISQLREGSTQTIKAQILAKGQRRSFRRRGFSITEVAAGDNTGRISCVWFNQPYLKEYFKVGETLVLYGKVERYAGRLQMSAPEFEIVSPGNEDDSLNIGRIVPVYSLAEGLTQRGVRRLIKDALDEYLGSIDEFLPYDIRSRNNLLNLARSLRNIHFPQDTQIQQESFRRLSFEEFLLFQLPLVLRKSRKEDKQGIAHKAEGGPVRDFIKSLDFDLTAGQKAVIEEIKLDMARPFSMQRLLQGDVGSGKTVVATISALIAIQGGYQAAFLVPTEILAKQHYGKISSQVSAAGSQAKKIKIGLLTSSAAQKDKEKVYRDVKRGTIDLVIGTHALLEEKVEFRNLGLVVIDEQHKFGVGQRVLLPQKGPNPDVLIMTATPIPRTLAITIYGDLDISVIRDLPPGRLPITTQWIKSNRRPWLYSFIREQLRSGRQAYIVYPVIEESYSLDLLSAKKMYADLKKDTFKGFKVGLIHGKMKQAEQDKVMSEFKAGGIQVLVATTVLEVGIDVANASVMVVEQAERFGLSQLHQLRGRIGRGKYPSFCVLVSDSSAPEAQARLAAMVKYNGGFNIAEEDLKIRGPGEFFGKRQHGLSELKIANPLTQMQLLKSAREEAIKIIQSDPRLELRQDLGLKEKLLHRFPEYENLMAAL
ncbi:MAG: ATP-dependent DNA helicase RecG [Candidatus Omnitrophica bacterium]|nr:ATP-dependent DNA helicase RecG [Candidatus Omnitrophota bacterium]